MLTRIPLNIVATATGQTTAGVLVAVMVSDLDALEAEVEDLREDKQAVIDVVNLYGDATLHQALIDIGWPVDTEEMGG